MLREREQKSWDEIIGNDEAETAGTTDGRLPGWRRGAGADPPAMVIGGLWGAILLTLFGVFPAALVVGTITAALWLLWRFLPPVVPRPASRAGSATSMDRGGQD